MVNHLFQKRFGIFFLLILFAWGFVACGKHSVKTEDDFLLQLEKSKKFLEKKKYYRAQEELKELLLKGRHTDLGDDIQYFLAESYYLNKEYLLAITEYEKLVLQMEYSPFVKEARWKICKSYAELSPKYFHDQSYTKTAIQMVQEFLDDFPDSEYNREGDEFIHSMRIKLAQKMFEAGILYLKLEEYQSAIQYFEQVIQQYYDTHYADESRYKIIETYLHEKKDEKASKFLKENEPKFKDSLLLENAREKVSQFQPVEEKK